MSDENPYQPPASETVAKPTVGEIVWYEQSLFGAIFGGALGAFIGIALWMMAVIVTGDNTDFMMLFVGCCVGFFVRFNGRGLSLRYRLVAVVFAWAGSIIGLWFTGLAIFQPIVLLAAGLIGAALACRPIDRDVAKSVWRFENGISEDAD